MRLETVGARGSPRSQARCRPCLRQCAARLQRPLKVSSRRMSVAQNPHQLRLPRVLPTRPLAHPLDPRLYQEAGPLPALQNHRRTRVPTHLPSPQTVLQIPPQRRPPRRARPLNPPNPSPRKNQNPNSSSSAKSRQSHRHQHSSRSHQRRRKHHRAALLPAKKPPAHHLFTLKSPMANGLASRLTRTPPKPLMNAAKRCSCADLLLVLRRYVQQVIGLPRPTLTLMQSDLASP